MSRQKKAILAIALLLCLSLGLLAIPIPQTETNSILILQNDFAPSETTYTNISMDFTDGDPYNGHSIWNYTVGSPSYGVSDGFYAMDCDSGEYVFFGIDEFVNNSIVMAEVEFRSVEFSASTYHYQPLGYFYQKTALESNTHWALVLYWSASGLRLYYNTGNGNTPSYSTLNASTPKEDNFYTCFLYNFGTTTYVRVIDITPLGDGTIYDGSVSTPAYDATSLYAGFGEYSSSGINTWGRWDDFMVSDVIMSVPDNGTGFNMIGAYLDEAYTHTFYDVDEGTNATLEVAATVTNITLLVECWLNATAYDVSTVAEGLNIIRHSVTVTSINSTVVFSQNNLTLLSGFDYGDGLFWYQYSVELDFVLQNAEIYTVIVTYEIFY